MMHRVLKARMAPLALVVLALVVLCAVLAPVLSPFDPNAQDLLTRLSPPQRTGGHLLGTDNLGRDVLSRLIYGARISLFVGLAVALISGTIGALVGIVAGYRGGWADRVLMRLADVQLAFPAILLALAVVAFLGNGLWVVIIVLGVTNWVSYARVARSSVLSLRERDYVLEARAIGVGPATIMRRHLLPNVLASLITIAALNVASAIVVESALSFLGLGVPADIPTWGSMLADGQLYLGTSWWIAVFPGLALMLTALSINITGDAIRDAVDPRTYR
ncbi:peptide ABC transporter permease [Mycolicibacterium smegmatis]|uniref:Binding-protein-dependent transport systems inner membrane component n=5 Tax=Mycobacteriales TaxID=85007 RepID=I7FP96_MYCS2|nr:ABC transporter permease [Mycolicibacterium smegmatis]AAL17918.1 putative oligopeptide permease OppC [Mycolicibacterium smegmatis MC2 155]AFP43110.1 Binding-protein-dependent transport systems inner membrane component [Mycolicibacterium smegmatis MC2 155]AIU11828.1 peptide ABC transporter permease [Mycolicibacterium smegmatis MC2 155]AIU18453.1 peptide ABC transporter permease [Mycolicibacterium smegmatis]AIU25075.1 peptide ABC transporter permease [Mycolicibacterium smegmatis]